MKTTTYKGSDLPKAFKNYARRQRDLINLSFAKLGGQVKSFSIGFYYFSGFGKVGDKVIYFAISDVRYFSKLINRLLVREAESLKDYTGKTNFFVDNYQSKLAESLKQIFNL